MSVDSTAGTSEIAGDHPVRQRLLPPVDDILSSVSPACRQLLSVAAVLGPQLDPEAIAEMIGQHTAALLPAWEEALDCGIVVARGGELTFVRESVRQAVLESLPGPIRQALSGLAGAEPQAQVTQIRAVGSVAAGARPGERLPARLTVREQTVLALLAQGRSNQQIARAVGISSHAVKRHVSNLMMKLDCTNRTEVALLAVTRHPLGQVPAS